MVEELTLAAACGLYCGDCESLGNRCRGCGEVWGKPFWTERYGVDVCPLYGCCVNQKSLEHCGLCSDFPCATFTSMRDPALSDEEAEEALQKRQNDLMRRREIGTEVWLKERT